MLQKNKRVLWLLNHKTLMAYEAKLLVELGFEVFTPKIIPNAVGFRSAGIDFSYDQTLTIPKSALKRLNTFDFYEKIWPADIVKLVNRYFGTAFIMPYGIQVAEALDKIEGQIILRAFGLENEKSYSKVLKFLHGAEVLRKIESLGKRFWFGEAYPQLHECERPELADRSLYLPIGVPNSFWKTQNTWTGKDKTILFVCPNCVTNPYYASIYAKFKRDFGDLPHIIVGAQDVPMDDPHFAGYVSNEELARLYRDCAVIYYHSTELRHVHYSPIEAAINSMPVVYFSNSLLGRMTENDNAGCINTGPQARAVIERLLSDDHSFAAQVSREQHSLAYKFSDEYCKDTWLRNMAGSGLISVLKQEPRRDVYKREAWRTLISPIARGLRQLPKPEVVLTTAEWIASTSARNSDGVDESQRAIDFTNDDLPHFVNTVKGLSFHESWGRWSDGHNITITLNHQLEKNVRIVISAIAYGPNIDQPIDISLGSCKRTVTFSSASAEQNTVSVNFKLRRPSNIIRIKVPHPVKLGEGDREIGIGLVRIQIEQAEPAPRTRSNRKLLAAPDETLPTASEWIASTIMDEASPDATIDREIDFTTEVYPLFVQSAHGLSTQGELGRRSIARKTVIVLRHTIQGDFRLHLRGGSYSSKTGTPLQIKVGNARGELRFYNTIQEPQTVSIDLSVSKPTNVIEIYQSRGTALQYEQGSVGFSLLHFRLEPIPSFGQDTLPVPMLGNLLVDADIAPPSQSTHIIPYQNTPQHSNYRIEFHSEAYPSFVRNIAGLFDKEPWGRWSAGDEVVISLNHWVKGDVLMELVGGGFSTNINAPISVKFGSVERKIQFPTAAHQPTTIVVHFPLRRKANRVRIRVPYPVTPEGGTRAIGLGLIRMTIVTSSPIAKQPGITW